MFNKFFSDCRYMLNTGSYQRDLVSLFAVGRELRPVTAPAKPVIAVALAVEGCECWCYRARYTGRHSRYTTTTTCWCSRGVGCDRRILQWLRSHAIDTRIDGRNGCMDNKVRYALQELSNCWGGRPFGNRHGPKSGRGVLCLFPWGELRPHLTQCRLSRGLYLGTKWHLDPPNRLAKIHQRYRQTTVP